MRFSLFHSSLSCATFFSIKPIESHKKVVSLEVEAISWKSTWHKITLPIQIFLIKNSASEMTWIKKVEKKFVKRLKSHVFHFLYANMKKKIVEGSLGRQKFVLLMWLRYNSSVLKSFCHHVFLPWSGALQFLSMISYRSKLRRTTVNTTLPSRH